MTTEKKTPSTRIDDVARLMASDSACAHSVWIRSRHTIIPTTNDNGRGPIERNPRCTALAGKTAARLKESGDDVYPSLHNFFEARGSRSGARLRGRPDLIARSQDGTVTVYDVSDGEASEADRLQVKLSMYLLPRSNHSRWRGSRPNGCVIYTDGTEHRIASDEIDEKFVERVATVMRKIASDEPAEHSPSSSECGNCTLTSEECSRRIEPYSGRPGMPLAGHTPEIG